MAFGKKLPPETGRIWQQWNSAVHTTSPELELHRSHLFQVELYFISTAAPVLEKLLQTFNFPSACLCFLFL